MIPIGRDTLLARIPWATALLAAVTTAVFFFTWPAEKAFLSVRWPDSPLVTEAKALASLSLDEESLLPPDMRTRLEDLRARSHFPDEESDRIIQTIQKTFDYLPTLKRPDWDLHYAAYDRARKEVTQEKIPWSSVLDRYTFRADDTLWPRLGTYFWVHAGYFHFLFCLFFLWLAGAHMEEEWGFIMTLLIYGAGAMAAALAVKYALPAGDWVLLGGTGGAAALMGGVLARNAASPVRFFYVLGVTYGIFTVPAWVVGLLFAGGLWSVGWLTDGWILGPTSWWMHGAGFLAGLGMGWLAGLGGGAGGWRRGRDTSSIGLQLRVEAAGRLAAQGKSQEARETYQEVLSAEPGHLAALQGLLVVLEFLQQEEEAGHIALRVIRTALERGQGRVAEDVFRRWSLRLFQTKMAPQERLVLAQNLENLQLWREALAYYRSVMEQAKDSPFAGKALFASAKIFKDYFKKPEDAVPLLRQLLDPPYDLEWRPLAEAELRALGKL